MPALFFMCDESWALAFAEIQKRKAMGLPAVNMPYYAGVCFILYTTWIGFAAFGAAVGPMFGDVAAWGFGMAFPAVFWCCCAVCGKALRRHALGSSA